MFKQGFLMGLYSSLNALAGMLCICFWQRVSMTHFCAFLVLLYLQELCQGIKRIFSSPSQVRILIFTWVMWFCDVMIMSLTTCVQTRVAVETHPSTRGTKFHRFESHAEQAAEPATGEVLLRFVLSILSESDLAHVSYHYLTIL